MRDIKPTVSNPINSLPPGHWYEVPNSHMRNVDPCPERTCSYSAVEGQSGVIDDWSGGAYDKTHNRLLVWGGGHWGYAGNEVYAFDINTLQWMRLTEPSNPTSAPNEPYAPDGVPASRHTYNYVQFVASIDRFCSFGGAALYGDGNGGTDNTDCFNQTTGLWEQKSDAVFYGIGAISAYDPSTGHIWGKGTGYFPSYDLATTLTEWDPVNDVWTRRDQGNDDLAYAYELTAAIDPERHLFLAVGGGQAIVWDIADPQNVTRSDLSATGDTEIENANDPGLVYDPVSGQFVAWSGGAVIYTLDKDTQIWTKIPPAPSNTVIPTAANSTGTYGRFRYIPSKNAFIVVNSVDENVFIYRRSAGGSDLGLVTEGKPNPAILGNPITYTISVENRGPLTATNVTLTETLPTGAIHGFTTVSQGSCLVSTGTVTCDLGALSAGFNVTVTTMITPTVAGMAVHSVSITTDGLDPNPEDNHKKMDIWVFEAPPKKLFLPTIDT
jgi:uncharacterized repeat protein (TIGR01451 family)